MSQTTSPRPTIRLADIALPEHDEASSAPEVNRVDRVDRVVVEASLTIVVGGEVVATTMRTPGHDAELTAGGLVSEEGLREVDDIAEIKVAATAARGMREELGEDDAAEDDPPEIDSVSGAEPALTYEDERLIAMAHQIAANMPVDQDVSERMATHLGTFWTPVMRDRLGSLAIEHPDMVSDDVRDALERANEGARR